jgi:cellulose synthase/poly-beta-1,6-N-acetylglucosamine synthase-like glycosyltransferase
MKRITIGIPSFNEEKNITQLLRSLVISNQDDFIISEVIISDDSLDSTAELVNSFSIQNDSLNIRFIHHSDRRGTAEAWNEIFEMAVGEIIVLYDADTIPNSTCTRELVHSIQGKVGLCASNPEPINNNSLLNEAAIFISSWLRSIRLKGLSQYTVMGRSLSIRSDLAKKIKLPNNIISVDLYLQCKVLEYGLEILYNDNAIVYFSAPKNMLDFASQIIRSLNGHKQIKTYAKRFGFELSSRVAIVETARNIICNPIGALAVGLYYSLIPYYRLKLKHVNSAQWHIAQSSKGIDYNTLK